MILLLLHYTTQDFPERVLAQRVRLSDSFPVITNRIVLGLEVQPKHSLVVLRYLNRLGLVHWIFPEIIQLPSDRQRVIELLMRVLGELVGDVHELRRIELLAEDYVLNYCLVLTRDIVLQPLDQLVSRYRRRLRAWRSCACPFGCHVVTVFEVVE